eukprot:CAMPEP_0177550104 /NCGR_PEP_ID=MMETSP0369-20130122/65388_1 /TAXON_ID=447022 ORGANISM="Scrippsiella hangoei-like, Strain SHHI-4" /NCGR_SAMPLE_ID=MMETSP0369 /ASSEMBLY_ACC=CAM_ASM_000364 /LENGTH=64 /DNA_ID=CAMNT_0019035271 /DNA_START=139 /DNA_END=334 /DNA_ORIENTATION=+
MTSSSQRPTSLVQVRDSVLERSPENHFKVAAFAHQSLQFVLRPQSGEETVHADYEVTPPDALLK